MRRMAQYRYTPTRWEGDEYYGRRIPTGPERLVTVEILGFVVVGTEVRAVVAEDTDMYTMPIEELTLVTGGSGE